MPYNKRRTAGLSNKVAKTLWGACGAQAVVLVTNLISTGQFDRVELAQLVGVAATAVGGLVVGYTAQPDNQTGEPPG